MLDEYKLIYEEVASVGVPDWKTINKNELVRSASLLQNGSLKDSYIAAIMLNYWHKISKFYNKCKLVASPEDVHTWLTISVMYAIDTKQWENENSSVYQDPNAPDKIINRCMECRRITFYQQLNRYNRKINSAILSLDSLTEDYKDAVSPAYMDSYLYEVHDVISKNFDIGEYLIALILNAILYEHWEVSKENLRRVVNYLKKLKLSEADILAERYDIKKDQAASAIKYCNSLTIDELRRKVEYSFIRLQNIIKEIQ